MLVGTAGNFAVILLGLVIFGILTRHLEPTGFGFYRSVVTYLALFGIFADLGTYSLCLREMSKAGADREAVLGNALTVRVSLALAVLGIGCVLSPMFSLDSTVVKGILIGMAGWAAYLVAEVLRAVFQLYLKQTMATVAEIAGSLVNCLLVVALASIGAGTLAMIGAMTVGHLTILVLMWWFASRLIVLRPRCDWSAIRTSLSAGWPIGGSAIITMLILRGDSLILMMLKPPEDVGMYGVAAKIFEILAALSWLFAGFVMPLLSQHAEQKKQFEEFFNNSFESAMHGAMLLLCILLLFADQLIVVAAGSDYLPGSSALRVLALAIVMVYAITIVRFALMALGLQRHMLRADAFGLAVAIPSYLILIPTLSYLGAALGSVLAYAATLTVALNQLRNDAKIRIAAHIIWQPIVSGAITVGVFSITARFDLHWILNLGIACAVYVGCAGLLHWISRKVRLHHLH